MPLTPKQEAFCLAYLETGNASEAYRRCYDVSKTKPESVNRLAKTMLDNVKIASRIAELRQPAVDAALITLESHLRRLDELSRGAQLEGQFSAAIQAEVARGKAAGLYTEKVEMGGLTQVVRLPSKAASAEEWVARHSLGATTETADAPGLSD